MVYLINQEIIADYDERIAASVLTQQCTYDSIKSAMDLQEEEEGWFSSALDSYTAKIASQVLGLDIPSIEEFGEFVGATPDDVAVMIADNMDLGDEAIAIEVRSGDEGTNSITFNLYEKVED